MSHKYAVGQRLSFDNALCTVRYIGQVEGTTGEWLGVEWDDPVRGKHSGEHKGKRYFTCNSNSLFVSVLIYILLWYGAHQTV